VLFDVPFVRETIPQVMRAVLYTEGYRNSIAMPPPAQLSNTLTGANAVSTMLLHSRHTQT
jgi:hypothetical protein